MRLQHGQSYGLGPAWRQFDRGPDKALCPQTNLLHPWRSNAGEHIMRCQFILLVLGKCTGDDCRPIPKRHVARGNTRCSRCEALVHLETRDQHAKQNLVLR